MSPTAPNPLSCSPNEDAACGLTYASQVLETGGLADALSGSEAPRLVQAAGGRLIPHADLQARIEDAARVVAVDPASGPIVQRVRQSVNTLVQEPREPISRRFLDLIVAIGSIVGVVLSVLPAFGVMLSPWFAVGVLGVSLGAYVAQLVNQRSVTRARERGVAEHEEAILALLRRSDEVRALLAQRARQSAHLTLDIPAV